jgi:radical SAM superfamily enzyme YgiQ (UPF0313 family)
MDAAGNRWDFEYTQNEILHANPDMLTINAVYFWEHTSCLFKFLSNLKASGFAGHINLFGFFPSLAWEMILTLTTAVDSIALGECENTLTELAQHLKEKKSWKHIPGLAFHEENNICTSGFRQPVSDLDGFAFPQRLNNKKTASVLASRGCYNQCSFCPVPAFYNNGPLWRGRTPENILSELNMLVDKGTKDIYFIDPNFIGPGNKGRQRIIKLAQLIRPLNITFGMETRPNDLDEKIMEQLAAAGLNSLLLGIESVSSSVLNTLNKGSSIHVSEHAIDLCRSKGIEPEIGFLMFVPDSSVEDIRQNFDFLMHNRLLDRLERTVNLLSHYQIVFSGTPGYTYFKKQKRLINTDDLGFEYEISYNNHRVKWMADIMVPVSRYVLKKMGQKHSPVFWDKKDKTCFNDANRLLIDIFSRLLKTIQTDKCLPPAESVKQDALNELEHVT